MFYACVNSGLGLGQGGVGPGSSSHEGGSVEGDECSQDATACFVLSPTHVQLTEKEASEGVASSWALEDHPRQQHVSQAYSAYFYGCCVIGKVEMI